MKPLLSPFAALRPAPGFAAQVVAPPYDVPTADEARAMAEGRPWSFLRVSRPEIQFPPGADTAQAHARGAETLRRMVREGVLVRDHTPAFYVYRLRMADHQQTGIAATASVAAYEAGRIRRHELTRPDKEADRVRHMETLDAQTGPVLLVHRADRDVAAVAARAAEAPPLMRVVAADGGEHTIWAIRDGETLAALTDAFEGMEALYIADGHHRSAAAARVAAGRRDAGRFLVVSFPHDQVRILDYNRVVRDLAGMSIPDFLARLSDGLIVEAADGPARPKQRGTFGMYLDGRWFRLASRGTMDPGASPLDRLDVNMLDRLVLGPLLGIGDPRLDPRIDFVGGARGLEALAARVDGGAAAVAFCLFPTALEDLMAVADAGQVMPPKSTWFEPKLADGLLSYPLGAVGA